MRKVRKIQQRSAKGKLTSIIYLLANGTNVNEKHQEDESYDGWNMRDCTPLHYAAQNGHPSVVEYYVNQKADINAKDKSVVFLYLMRLLFH